MITTIKHIQHRPAFSVDLVTAHTGISAETIRMYERKGLILPCKTILSHQLYSLNDLERILSIHRMLTEDGMNIEDVRLRLSLKNCWQRK
jgi:DNA-binding transcriptional MerR regulator